MKKLLPYLLIALASAGVTAFVIFHFFGPDPEYWVERAKYDALADARVKEHADAIIALAAKDQVIKNQDKGIAEGAAKIAGLEAEKAARGQTIAERDKQIEALTKDAAVVIEANPAVKRLFEAQAAQIAELKQFNLALQSQVDELGIPIKTKGVDAETGEPIFVYPPGSITWRLNEKAQAYRAQRDTWKMEWEKEVALHQSETALRLGLEKRLYGGKFWKTVALLEPPIFAGLKVFKVI